MKLQLQPAGLPKIKPVSHPSCTRRNLQSVKAKPAAVTYTVTAVSISVSACLHPSLLCRLATCSHQKPQPSHHAPTLTPSRCLWTQLAAWHPPCLMCLRMTPATAFSWPGGRPPTSLAMSAGTGSATTLYTQCRSHTGEQPALCVLRREPF